MRRRRHPSRRFKVPVDGLAWTALGVVLLTGCHYRLLRGDAPFGAHRIAVVPVVEDVPLGLAPDLTEALVAELRAGGVQVVYERAAADAVLNTVVKSSRTQPSPTTARAGARIQAYQVKVLLEVALVNTQGATLWSTAITLDEDFLPGASELLEENAVLTEANRRRALRRTAARAASRVHQTLLIAGGMATPPAAPAPNATGDAK